MVSPLTQPFPGDSPYRRSEGFATSPVPAMSLDLHGVLVSLRVDAPSLRPVAADLLGVLKPVVHLASPQISGVVSTYDEQDVVRRISPEARPIHEGEPGYDGFSEIYALPDGSRFWLIDERWGLCEIDPVRRRFHSFVIDQPTIDGVALLEASVYWPLSRLLPASGLHLIPGVSLAQAGRGVLALSPFLLDRELQHLAPVGVNVLGQRWTCLRSATDPHDGEPFVELLHMPGRIATHVAPRQATTAGTRFWYDATSPLLRKSAVRCELVLVMDPGRSRSASARPLDHAAARALLEERWPVRPLRRQVSGTDTAAQLHRLLSSRLPVHRVTLGRDPADLCRLLVRRAPNQSLASAA